MKHRCVLCRPLSGRLIHLQYPILPLAQEEAEEDKDIPKRKETCRTKAQIRFRSTSLLRKSRPKSFHTACFGGKSCQDTMEPSRKARSTWVAYRYVCLSAVYEMPSGAKLFRSPFPRWVAAYWKFRGSIELNYFIIVWFNNCVYEGKEGCCLYSIHIMGGNLVIALWQTTNTKTEWIYKAMVRYDD